MTGSSASSLEDLAVDRCITKTPSGGQFAGRSLPSTAASSASAVPAGRGGTGIPLGRVLAPPSRHDSPLLAATLFKLDGPRPASARQITVHLDAGYDSRNYPRRARHPAA